MRRRIKIFLVFASAGLLFLALCKQYFHFCVVEERLQRQRDMQYFSVLFAEDLMRLSDEMTAMARCYIASGDPHYLEKFSHVIDIHEGRAVRTVEADLSLLSIFREDGVCPPPFDKPMEFMEMARRAGFTGSEYALLEKANESSEKLGEVARDAIRVAESDPGAVQPRLTALQMLVSEDYLRERERVMDMVHDFQGLVAERTGRMIQDGEKLAERLRYLLIGLGLLFSVAAFLGMLLESRKAEHFHDYASRDPLTNLASRNYLHEHLTAVTQTAEAHGEIVLLAFVDLNGFKPINDRYGHRKGDELLKLVADCLHAQCRKCDLVARYGGDEYVIVFVSAMKHREESIARMRDTIGRAFDEVHKDETGSQVGAAVGISVFPCPAPTVDELIRTADKAMYRAKSQERAFAVSVYEMENSLSYVDRNVEAAAGPPVAFRDSA